MAKNALRLEQYDTVLYNANLNPMGVPESAKKALKDNIDSIIRYPNDYYSNLKGAIAEYAGCKESRLILGNGSIDLLRLFIVLTAPKKALILSPCSTEYERSLKLFGCEVDRYELSEENDYALDIMDFAKSLDSSYDLIILGNPNNPTSQIIDREDIDTLAEVCEALETFLLIDEMYIEFTEQYEQLTSVPLIEQRPNLGVMRSVSKFFAVPGLRLSYLITANDELLSNAKTNSTPNNISTLTAAACTEMLKDKKYIEESRSQIFTERNLIISAMTPCKNVKLYKPYANFVLVKLLKDDVNAADIAEKCKLKGLIIRCCDDFEGLSDKYIRFCFMNPSQNDMLVNTILESL